MFSIADGYFTTLAFDDDSRAYVGTGIEGRVYRVAPDRRRRWRSTSRNGRR